MYSTSSNSIIVMKPELRVNAECGDQKQVELKGWTRKKKRGPRLRFSSSKAQRRAKRRALHECSGQEGSAGARVVNFECIDNASLTRALNGAGIVGCENGTSTQDCRSGIGDLKRFLLVGTGEIPNVQNVTEDGRPLRLPSLMSGSDMEVSGTHGQCESQALPSVDRSVGDIFPSGGMEGDDVEARTGSEQSTPTSIPDPNSEVNRKMVSPLFHATSICMDWY